MSRHKILFSHRDYKKFKGNPPTEVILLGMNVAYYDNIPEELIRYDIMYGDNKSYKLNKTQKYIMLFLFDPEHNNIFTSLRPHREFKEQYYRDQLFQKLEVIYQETNLTGKGD